VVSGKREVWESQKDARSVEEEVFGCGLEAGFVEGGFVEGEDVFGCGLEGGFVEGEDDDDDDDDGFP
jgi:hypothetical protein